jgi:HK97 family phage prohead protease
MREREFASFKPELAAVETHGRSVTAYASVFNYPIDSGSRNHTQTTFVRPGAFTKTLNESRERIQVMVNHGMSSRYGMDPVATLTDAREDGHGLKVSFDIVADPFFDPLVAQIQQRAFRAMSIQFETTKESFNEDRTERNLEEIALWELGPVSFPANEAATIASMHSIKDFIQAEPLEDESRESTLDVSRLTWVRKASRKLELEDEELEAMAARMAALRSK